MDKIGILGCGWLGLPLAKKLQEMGYSVKGSVSRKERLPLLEEARIIPYRIQLNVNKVLGPISGFLDDIEVLIVAIPPGLRKNPAGSFRQKIEALLPHITKAGLKKIGFVSSTSVYGEIEGRVTEETLPMPKRPSAVELFEVENLIKTTIPGTTIIRMGGLIGPDRQPIRQLSGKTGLKGKLWPVNLIQQDDAMDLLCYIIQNQMWGTIINGVHPEHPDKETYYKQQAELLNIPPPEFDLNDDSRGKQVDSIHKKPLSGFRFRCPI